MSNIIKPTIGRKVWYRHDGAPLVAGLPAPWTPTSYSDQPMDATVIYVWGDRMVNLRITDHAGNTFSLSSVTLVQPGDATPGSRHCEWMPYQQGQARKEAAAPVVAQAATTAINSEDPRLVTSAAGFSLDDDKPLAGGVCDMSAGCEACQ